MTDRMTNELLIKRLRRNPLICTDRVDATGAAADRIEEQQERISELEEIVNAFHQVCPDVHPYCFHTAKTDCHICELEESLAEWVADGKAMEQRISELEQQVAEYEARDSRYWHSIQKRTDGQARLICKLEDGIARIAAEAKDKGAHTWAMKLRALLKEQDAETLEALADD